MTPIHKPLRQAPLHLILDALGDVPALVSSLVFLLALLPALFLLALLPTLFRRAITHIGGLFLILIELVLPTKIKT